MGHYQKTELLEMGLSLSDIEKAERHFGSGISNEAACNWIFDGCPDYKEAPDGSRALVHVPQNSNTTNTSNERDAQRSGWDVDADATKSTTGTDWQNAGALASLQHGGQQAFDAAQAQWAGFVPGPHNLPEAEADGKGRAGRPSPVEGTESNPIHLSGGNGGTVADNDSMPPLVSLGAGGDDDEMEKAIKLSLEEQHTRTQSMSRTGSKTRAEKEQEDMDKALSMSLADIGPEAPFATEHTMEIVDEPGAIATRPSKDVPVALTAPPFLSHLPSLVLSFFHNAPFRSAVLSLDFPYKAVPSYERYGKDASLFTRRLLSEDGTSVSSCTIQMAALQRLFVLLEQSDRACVGLEDVLDAFEIAWPQSPLRGPPQDHMLFVQHAITSAFLEHFNVLLDERINKEPGRAGELAFERERLRNIVFYHGINIDNANRHDITAEDPPPELFTDQTTAWLDSVELNSWYPDCNDTYTALNNRMGSPTDMSFLLQASDSLYMHVRRINRPNMQDPVNQIIGPQSSADGLDDIARPFGILPEIYLDRYDWSNRVCILELRQKSFETQEAIRKLQMRRAKLTTLHTNGKPIVDLSTKDVGETAEDKAKGVLDQVAAYLQMLATDTPDQAPGSAAQGRLLEKLKKIAAILKDEIQSLEKQITSLQQDDLTSWEEKLPKTKGPYALKTISMWTGLPGRTSYYCYVQSGFHDRESESKRPRWWKIQHDEVREATLEDALNDKTGVYMPGGGTILQSYVLKSAEAAVQGKMSVNPVLLTAAHVDNQRLKPEPAASGQVGQPNEPVPDEQAKQASSDVQMAAESQEPVVASSNAPLRLSGGSSRARRSSISSDTGSVASTSKVRIGDEASDDEEYDEDAEETVELGFAVPLKKGFKVVKDVGKIGGKPTWLNPALPLESKMVICEVCQERMELLVQINAPLDELPQAIYRTFYIYTCKKASCMSKKHLGSVKVYRVQLPEKNAFYEVSDPEEQATLQRFRDKQYATLCQTCKMSHGRDETCKSVPWKEWLIETGPEEIYEDDAAAPDDLEATMQSATLSDEDLSADANEPDTKSSVDSAFLKFQERLRNEPDQVLRYYYRDVEKRAQPLWVSDEGKALPSGIDKCHCGSERSCEFQILSTILSYIGVDDLDKDSLDFGTIAVYTCDASCSTSSAPAYEASAKEFGRFAPSHGWEEEVGYVQAYSSRGVEFR